MKPTVRHLILTFPLIAMLAGGCGNGAFAFRGNSVFIRENGQTLIKGFGSGKAKSVVCTLSPGPYGSKRTQKTEGSIDVVKYVSAKLSSEATSQAILLFAQSEKLQALDAVMSQVCIAYGNGAFGEIGSTHAVEKYFAEVHALLDLANGTAQANGTSQATTP